MHYRTQSVEKQMYGTETNLIFFSLFFSNVLKQPSITLMLPLEIQHGTQTTLNLHSLAQFDYVVH